MNRLLNSSRVTAGTGTGPNFHGMGWDGTRHNMGWDGMGLNHDFVGWDGMGQAWDRDGMGPNSHSVGWDGTTVSWDGMGRDGIRMGLKSRPVPRSRQVYCRERYQRVLPMLLSIISTPILGLFY